MPNAFVFSVSPFFGPFWSAKPAFLPSKTLTFKHGMKCCLTLELNYSQSRSTAQCESICLGCVEEFGEEKGEIKIMKTLKLSQCDFCLLTPE